MRTILKGRWLVIIAWIIACVLLVATMPSFNELVREKGQITVPDHASSNRAYELLSQMETDPDGKSMSLALVYHQPDGLSATQLKEIEAAVQEYEKNRESLGLKSMTTHFNNEELKDQLVSKDGKTILVAMEVQLDGREIAEVRQDLREVSKDVSAEYYFTGNTLIEEDNIVSAQEGLKKTEWITVGFILIVLFLVFRSFITPIIPLVTVGISYLAAQAIVAFLVDLFNFPLSNFTQIFMVVVMFGIGTDYCILLLSRYKEELGKEEDLFNAIITTYRTAGKTVFFSGLAVLVGFAAIGFSTFKLYKSAAAVAVGVAILIVALYTVVPFFMAVFGKKMFWPAKGKIEHKQSRMWEMFGRFSLKRPVLSLLLVACIVLPFLAFYDGTLSFNSVDEIGDGYESVKGFNLIAESFGPGESLPGTLVLKHTAKLDSPENLALLEKINQEIAKIDGVAKVRSVTRPMGEELEDFYIASQAKALDDGVGAANNGLRQISSGLSEASKEITNSSPQISQAASGIEGLVKGTHQLKNGLEELATGLTAIEKGLIDGSIGAAQLKLGLEEAQKSAAALAQGTSDLLAHYKEMEAGLSALTTNYRSIETELNTVSLTLQGLQTNFAQLNERYPNLAQDQDYRIIVGTISKLQEGTKQLGEGLATLNEQLSKVTAGMGQANTGLEQVAEGQHALAKGLGEIVLGLDSLNQGIHAAANGQSQVIKELPKFSAGLQQISGGQEELLKGFKELGGQLSQLTDGLDQSVDGLNQVTDGLAQAQSYLAELSATQASETTGFYIPEEALENQNFQKVLDVYMSEDRKVAKFDIVFAENPYSLDAIEQIPRIENAIKGVIKGTELEQAEFGITGVSGVFSDLKNISEEDYSRTVIFMLVGIALVLIILLRSIIAPMYLILSLILCYYTSLAITEFIFMDLLGYSGVSWTMPFFGFVILVALGIDYSIFLMDRFNEYRHLPVELGIVEAMKNMGTVIISAAVILGGTFAALYPSGMLSLLQIATLVISGLFLYSIVFLPFFVPVMVKLFGKANWWPFER